MTAQSGAGGAPAPARFGALVVRFRYAVVLITAAVIAAATLTLPALGDAPADLGGEVPGDAAAIDAQRRSAELFGFPMVTRTMVVQRDPSGLAPSELRRSFRFAARVTTGREEGFREVAAVVPVLNSRTLLPGAPEDGTTLIHYLYFVPESGAGQRTTVTHRYATRLGGPATVGATGSIPARVATADRIREALPLVTAATALLVAVIVTFAFRSLAAPLLVLVSVGAAYQLAVHVAGAVGRVTGAPAPAELEPVVVVLLFGIVTDYAIFLFTAARRRTGAGEAPHAAVAGALGDVGEIIAAAGTAVALATLALLFSGLAFFRAFGPGLAVTAVVATVVALTLVPALAAISGRRLFWPGAPRASSGGRAGTTSTLTRSRRRAGVAVATAVAALLLATLGLTDLRLGVTIIEGLPGDDPVPAAAAAADRGFGPGAIAPVVLLVEGAGVGRRPAALARVQAGIAATPGVAGVLGPGDRSSGLPRGLVVGALDDAARYLVLLDDPPLRPDAIDTLRTLRTRVPRLAEREGLGAVRVAAAGDTALMADVVAGMPREIARVGLAALLAVLVLLTVLLRSVVAPLYLLAANVLALTGALGASAWVLDAVGNPSGISYFVPFAAAILLVALGSDYNVFLIGRVWALARDRPLHDALARAVPESRRAITLAGLVLAASFSLLALVPVESFREFGLVMTLGILLDVFLVRAVLVPALITLVGPVGMWPGGNRGPFGDADPRGAPGDHPTGRT